MQRQSVELVTYGQSGSQPRPTRGIDNVDEDMDIHRRLFRRYVPGGRQQTNHFQIWIVEGKRYGERRIDPWISDENYFALHAPSRESAVLLTRSGPSWAVNAATLQAGSGFLSRYPSFYPIAMRCLL